MNAVGINMRKLVIRTPVDLGESSDYTHEHCFFMQVDDKNFYIVSSWYFRGTLLCVEYLSFKLHCVTNAFHFEHRHHAEDKTWVVEMSILFAQWGVQLSLVLKCRTIHELLGHWYCSRVTSA